MYVFAQEGNEGKITDKTWEKVRDQLIIARINGGHPYLVVEDGDHNRNGELVIAHQFEGMELDVKYIEKTLPHVYYLWGRPVHLRTIIEGKDVIFSFDGKKNVKKLL